MRRGFAEAKSRVQAQTRALDAGRDAGARARLELAAHLAHDITILGIALHIGRLAAHVHQADGQFAGGCGFQSHRRTQRTHVVDHVRPGRGGAPYEFRIGGVYGDQQRQSPRQLLDDGQYAAQFFLAVHRVGAGPRGFAADVEDGRALLGHGLGTAQRRIGLQEQAAIGE